MINGDGDDDFVVGDNGSIARVVDGGTTDRVYTPRYGTSRTGHAKVRVAGGGAASTRFCPTTGNTAASTCEKTGAYGRTPCSAMRARTCSTARTVTTRSGAATGDDDVYGELGADVLYGEDGEDAILGDRGGVQDRYENGSRSTSTTLTTPPAVTFTLAPGRLGEPGGRPAARRQRHRLRRRRD